MGATAVAAKRAGEHATPAPLARWCLDRVTALLGERSDLRVLEPAVGDGAFLAVLGEHAMKARVREVIAVEPDASAAPVGPVDVVVGRPVAARWVAVTLRVLDALGPGGVLGLLLPGDFVDGAAAGTLRARLAEALDLHVDPVPADRFPGGPTEMVLVTGARRRAAAARVAVRFAGAEHLVAPGDPAPWTRMLLSGPEREAFAAALERPGVVALGALARVDVGALTGANRWFCVEPATVERFGLGPWARPLIARPRDTPGLAHRPEDHARAVARGERAFLLDFNVPPDPSTRTGARAYLREGIRAGVPTHYKCRIRRVWFRIPGLRAAPIVAARRVNRYPFLVANPAAALVTDTMYRVTPRNGAPAADDLVAAFPSSLTLLAAELYGRVLGGGVLELVPSVFEALPVRLDAGAGASLPALDALSRRSGRPDRTDDLVDAVDAAGGEDPALIAALRDARHTLLNRRRARPGR